MEETYRGKLQKIRQDLLLGRFDYKQAKELAQPIIDEMNLKANKIAKEYGKRHKPFTFNYLMR